MLKIVLAVGLTAALGWFGGANAADRLGRDDSDNARFSERT